jgi:hypothetical protein
LIARSLAIAVSLVLIEMDRGTFDLRRRLASPKTMTLSVISGKCEKRTLGGCCHATSGLHCHRRPGSQLGERGHSVRSAEAGNIVGAVGISVCIWFSFRRRWSIDGQ